MSIVITVATPQEINRTISKQKSISKRNSNVRRWNRDISQYGLVTKFLVLNLHLELKPKILVLAFIINI